MWRRQLVLCTGRFLALFSCDIVNMVVHWVIDLANYNHDINHILFIRFIWDHNYLQSLVFPLYIPLHRPKSLYEHFHRRPWTKKNSMFSSCIWGDFHRLIINRTIHASIGLRLQYKVLSRLYELPLRPRKWNWGADFGSLLSASGKRLILDLWDEKSQLPHHSLFLSERRG